MNVPTRLTVDAKLVAGLPARAQRALRTTVREQLLEDPYWGDKIDRERWPKRFKGLPNLFRFELPEAQRGLYSVLTYPGLPREIRIVWVGNHKQYDRFFGCRTS